MMIDTVYLDMDGVIVNCLEGLNKYNALNVETNKVDWKILDGLGRKFWVELDWLPQGKLFYTKLSKLCNEQGIDLCILSAIPTEEGKDGKRIWLKEHTNIPSLNIHFVDKARLKKNFADEHALLIDDLKMNCDQFIEAGGNAILYRDGRAKDCWEKIVQVILGISVEGMNFFESLKKEANVDTLNESLVRKKVIRKGKKKVKIMSTKKNYRIQYVNGKPKEVRITAKERRKRKIGQRKGKIKRNAKKAIIKAKRDRSFIARKSQGLSHYNLKNPDKQTYEYKPVQKQKKSSEHTLHPKSSSSSPLH